jgi:ERCC4-related helicase
MRIWAELDRTSADKLVWFIAPTVQLCNQQAEVLNTQIPVQLKLLRGEDSIEAWSNQDIWDAALFNVRIVVSTPQILLDAVTHAFVSMDRLALIVFDEG